MAAVAPPPPLLSGATTHRRSQSLRLLTKSQVTAIWRPLKCSSCNHRGTTRDANGIVALRTLHTTSSRYLSLLASFGMKGFIRFGIHIHRIIVGKEKLRQVASTIFIRMVTGLLVMSLSLTVTSYPSWSLTAENLLFLEAWRIVDRAYYDKTFNGQTWFRYREDALRNEPMNTREETCK